MPIKSNYLFVVSMDIDPDKEALFKQFQTWEAERNARGAQARVPGPPTQR